MNIEGPYCQGPSQVRVSMDKNVVRSEKLSRHGLREGHGVIFMLELLSERLESALKPDCEWDPRSELRLVSEWLELVKVSAFRANTFTSSIQVLLKDLIREKTLESLSGSFETKRSCVIPIMLLIRFLALCRPALNLLFILRVILIGSISFSQSGGVMTRPKVVLAMVILIFQVFLANKRELQIHLGICSGIK